MVRLKAGDMCINSKRTFMKGGIYLSKVVISFVPLWEVWASKTEVILIIFVVLMYNIQNKSANLYRLWNIKK